MEVTQHVKHRLEPQVLDVALPVAIQGQAQVLWAQIRMVRGGVLDWQMPLGVTGRTKSHRSPLGLWQSWLLAHESHLGVGVGGGESLLWWGLEWVGGRARLEPKGADICPYVGSTHITPLRFPISGLQKP